MPKVMSVFPSDFYPQEKYPWDEWLDGQIWGIAEGVDFPAGRAEEMVGWIRKAARERYINVRIESKAQPHCDNALLIYLQATKKKRVPVPTPDRVLQYIERKGGSVAWRDTYRGLRITGGDFKDAIAQLVCRGLVTTDATVDRAQGRVTRLGTYVALI